jgi:hypothetical protein
MKVVACIKIVSLNFCVVKDLILQMKSEKRIDSEEKQSRHMSLELRNKRIQLRRVKTGNSAQGGGLI